MATRKRKGNLSKQTDKTFESTDDDDEIDTTAVSDEDIKVEDEDANETSEDAETSFEENAEIKGDITTEEDDMEMSSEGIMSLDVLAQVAADRLEIDPGPATSGSSSLPKKMSKRSLLNMDFLHLDQIRTLSPKFLVNLFAEMNSNEITRNYSYTCYIIPEKCNMSYSSFGSEIRARDLIKSHLQRHVEDLIKLKSANTGFSFIAETVVAKKKRELAEKNMRKRKAWNVGVNKISKKAPLKPPSKNKAALSSSSKKLTGQKPSKSKHRKNSQDKNEVHVSVSIIKKPREATATSTGVSSGSGGKKSQDGGTSGGDFPMILHDDDFVIPINAHEVEEESEADDESGWKQRSKADGEWDIIEDKAKIPFKRTGRNVERNEKIIWDILCASQPYHDHSYTTVFGKRKAGQAFEEMDFLEMDDDVDESARQSSRTGGLKFASPSPLDLDTNPDPGPVIMKLSERVENKLHIPMVRVQFPVSGGENSALISSEVMGHTVNRPYPPMPKSDLAHQGRLKVMEEQVSSSEDEPQTAAPAVTRTAPVTPAVTSSTAGSSVISPTKKRYKRKATEGTLEWERRLALKCIRELRLRKKEENNGLICKICKDKTFTATATLMYHYRSHAGIKPFVCLICNTTFTRQHSLNYHMLIHNNQSRFTCVDCGRKFRHPSHFKEHLRRHTGETPFHCMDCPLRFKTRNTYKRHLRTRHGKLLTANGIRIMPREEFLKIRSRYVKKEMRDDMDDEDLDEDDAEDEDAEDDTKYQINQLQHEAVINQLKHEPGLDQQQHHNDNEEDDVDAEIDLEGVDSESHSKDGYLESLPTRSSEVIASIPTPLMEQTPAAIAVPAQSATLYAVPITQQGGAGIPLAITTVPHMLSSSVAAVSSSFTVPLQVSGDQGLATIAFPIKVTTAAQSGPNLATVAVPVHTPNDQKLSALSDTSGSSNTLQAETSASNKLLQLCSQVVQQEVG